MIDLSQKEAIMDQIHKRFTVDQVKILLQSYIQGTITRSELEKILQISKTRFFELLKEYRQDPAAFSIVYQRKTPAHLSPEVETVIATEPLREKDLMKNPDLRSS